MVKGVEVFALQQKRTSLTDKDSFTRHISKEELKLLARFPEENPHPVFRVSRDGKVCYANKASVKLLKANGVTLGSYVPKEWESAVNDVFMSDSAREIKVAVDGRVFMLSFTPIEGDDFLYAYSTDVTDRVAAENAMRRSSESLARAQRIAKVGSWDWNIATNDLEWSDETYRIFGANPVEVEATYEGFLSFIHPDDRDSVDKAVNNCLATGSPCAIEHRVVTSKGEERIVKEYGELFLDSSGKPEKMVGTVQDITDMRKTEESLNKAQSLSHTGSWEWDIPSGKVVWSDEHYRIFGLEPQKTEATYELFMKYVHPDDAGFVVKSIEDAFSGKKKYEVEHRVIKEGGERRVCRGQGEVQFGDDGKPRKMVGTIQDITDMRKSEDSLKLARTIFESAHEGVVICGADVNIESVNPAFTKITGYAEEEVIGKNPSFLQSDRHSAEFYKAMWAEIEKTGYWSGEIWNRRKNGEAYPELLSITAEKNSCGGVEHYIAVFTDLTGAAGRDDSRYKENYDPLTGLPNRILFADRLNQSIAHTERSGGILSLIILGLDGFVKVNNRFGYAAGDKVLQEASKRIMRSARDVDTVSRFGSDEFGLILGDIKNSGVAAKMGSKIMESFSEPFKIGGEDIFLTISVGIALYPNDGRVGQSVIKNCDIAMQRAKELGGDRCQLFTSEMNEKAMKRLTLEKELRLALRREELLPFFQPKVSIGTGKMIGMEALARWDHPEKGLVSPAEFIPIAEETGLIVPMGEHILRESCRINKVFQDAGYPPMMVAVNLSPKQFTESNIVMMVESVLEETNLSPEYLEMEITESMVMEDVENAIATLKKLNEMGITLSIDDFGTGYSSLGYLKRFPIDALKIDMIFIRDMTVSSDDAEIVSAIISMAKSLNLKVIAEGVETKEQLELLREYGCDQIQGYYYSKPLNKSVFELLLKRGKKL